MLIECLVDRKEPIIVPIGNEKYEFKPDPKGRRIAEVWVESHIECFLAVKHLYREVKEETPQDPSIVNLGDDRVALRAEYQQVLGKAPFNGWSADELRAKIAEAKAGPNKD